MEKIGFLAAILTTISFLPQAITTIRYKNTDGLSALMYLILSLGVFLWCIYGITIKDIPIILANAITLILTLIILSVILLNKKKANKLDR